MNKNNLKNRIFKSTMKIIGNKGLANNSLGNSIKKILVKSSKSNEAIVNGCKMQLDENDIMQISLYDYEPIETELVKSTVKKNDITIDVGANIGYYTLLMAKIGAFVHSYEPEPNNFKLLSTNVHQNNFSKYVTLNNKAVSNFNGISKLFLSQNTPWEHKLNYDRFHNEQFIEVPVTKINLDKINFAKIDAEGTELNVLRGMKVLPEKILIEFNSKELKTSGAKIEEFFEFIQKFTVKEVTKNGLVEPDFEKLTQYTLATNLFLY